MAVVPAIFSEKLFMALGQHPEVSAMTAIQVRLLLPSVFLQGLYDLWKRWLACQCLTFVPMVCMIVGAFAHIPLCYICVHTFDMGVSGLAVASCIKDAIFMLTIYTYARCSP